VTDPRPRAARRSEALSRARIVQAAIEILDEGGADALTFRVLAAHLSTGPGAIYHHVADRADLLATAANEVITSVLELTGSRGPQQDVRAVMLGAFDAIEAHPWLGTQLAGAPWQPAVLQLLERVGSRLSALRVPEQAQFDAASVLVHHVLGFASQLDAVAHLPGTDTNRPVFLRRATRDLTRQGDADEYPFITRIAEQLAGHDDREQYKNGVEVILAGIATL
jgi:AcrR family transcriptional regulator